MGEEATAAAVKPDAPGFLRIIAPAFVVPLLLFAFGLHRPDNVAFYLQTKQNAQLLIAEMLLLAIVLIPVGLGPAALRLTVRQLALLALLSFIVGYAGHYWLLDGYDLSRDEQMATFDAMIYGAGHLVWPLPAQWQAATAQLNTSFMLSVAHPVAWVSAYLPGNALLRAAFARIGDAALTGPLLNVASVFLLWGCARRIWPGRDAPDREACCVALMLLVLSGQFEFSGMTSYAMTAHLTCNLLWLWLFLRDRRGSDLASLPVSFLATGLHQPLFHPMFIAPFLGVLLLERRWARFAMLAGCNLAIAGFWFAWPYLTNVIVSGSHASVAPVAGNTSYLSRLLDVLSTNHDNIGIMLSNLLHFVSWQHLLLLPLLFAGVGVARRDWRAAALTAGLVLPILVMTLILPWQGNGFGYRYLHGLLGNAALLGGFGWRQLEPWRDRLRPLFFRASLASLLVLALQARLTHAVYSLYAEINARITASGADYIVIGDHDIPLAHDLVLNRPDLKNRPIRFEADNIGDVGALAQQICHPGVTMGLPSQSFFRNLMRYYSWPDTGGDNAPLYKHADAFRKAGCKIAVLQ